MQGDFYDVVISAIHLDRVQFIQLVYSIFFGMNVNLIYFGTVIIFYFINVSVRLIFLNSWISLRTRLCWTMIVRSSYYSHRKIWYGMFCAQSGAKIFFDGVFCSIVIDVLISEMDVGHPNFPDLSGENISTIYFFNPCLH